MVLIYSSKTSYRLEYVCEVLFRHILQTDFKITLSLEEYHEYDGLKLAYQNSSSLLFEEDIRFQEEDKLFEDPYALAFYVLTCYEEYLPDQERDRHGRLNYDQSFLVRHGLEKIPLVHHLADIFKSELLRQNPNITENREYQFLPTFDIDIAYRSKGKTWLRFLGACTKAFFSGDLKKIQELYCAKFDTGFSDPFDVFDTHEQLCRNHNTKPVYFCLTSSYSRYDKNIAPKSSEFQKLMQKLQTFSEIGLHPSYYSTLKKLYQEKKQLETIIQQPVVKSRQHFLRIKFPDTYRNLIQAGICEDYTLGYHDRIGFRAGICVPFPFFDLLQNQKTELQLHPLIFMDGALIPFENNATEYFTKVLNIAAEVKKVNGCFTALWHNSSMMRGSVGEMQFKALFKRLQDQNF